MSTARWACAQSNTASSLASARATSEAWITCQCGLACRSHAVTDRGTFWSRRMQNGSGERDNLQLVDDLAGVFQSGDDVFAAQLRILLQNAVERVAAGKHPQYVAHHDPRSADTRFTAADGRVDADSLDHAGGWWALGPVLIHVSPPELPPLARRYSSRK